MADARAFIGGKSLMRSHSVEGDLWRLTIYSNYNGDAIPLGESLA